MAIVSINNTRTVMRNFIFQLIIIASALFAGVSCSKEKVTLYTEAPGIYFNGFSTTYNFTEHPENVEIGCDTVNIPFLITGSAMDKERVIMACNIIINDLIGRLYRYDYRFGYDITLASEHSIAKKLSDNWQNEWAVLKSGLPIFRRKTKNS